MKISSKILTVALSLLMLVSSIPFATAYAEETEQVIEGTAAESPIREADVSTPDARSDVVEGNTEYDVTWTLDDEGTLRVDAVNLPNYDEDFTSWEVSLAPWFNEGSHVKTIIISENVRYIGSYAFNTCVKARNIIIPDTVEFIASNAFENVPAFENAPTENGIKYYKNVLISADTSESCSIKEGTTCIVNGAFREETDLTEVTLPSTLNSIGRYAFYGCTALKKLNMPDSVTRIGSSAFQGCLALDSISLSPKLKEIEDCAFCNTSLTEINLPSSLVSIKASAFKGTGLKSLTIPDSVTEIGSNAFANCQSLTSVKLSKNLTSVENNIFDGSPCTENIGGVSYADTLLMRADTGLNGVHTVREGTLYIARGAFSDCTDLTEAVFPEALQYIGEMAFWGCSSLSRAVIPDNVSIIEKSVFSGCSSLCDIKLPSSITRICRYTFYNCSALTNLSIPEGVTHIEDCLAGVPLETLSLPSSLTYIEKQWDFNYGIKQVYINDLTAYCSIKFNAYYDRVSPHSLLYNADALYVNGVLLEDLVIPEGITVIDRSFEGYKALKTVTLPDSLTEIGDYAFKDCPNLETVNFNDSCRIGKYAFYNCDSIVKIGLKRGITAIGDRAFSHCSSLLNLTIPDTVTEMGEYVFEACPVLNRVTFNAQIKEIPVGTFKQSGLPSFTIPEWIESIGREAFCETKKLTSITIPDSVVNVYYGAFANSNAITKKNGFVYVENVLISSTLRTEAVRVPDGITVIAYAAFDDYGNYQKNIILPDGLIGISYGAFKNCEKLETVRMPESLISIGAEAFYGCKKLSNIVIPPNVESFGDYCFANCSSLTEFILPESAKSIGSYIISGCSSLENIYFYDMDKWLEACSKNFVPSSADNVNFYYNGELLKDVTVEGISELPYYAFAYCGSLETVTLSSDVTSIGSGAFNGCKNLKYIFIPESVTSIDTYFAKSDQMKIRCYTGSYAHKYALNNNIKYELVDGNAYTYPDVASDSWYAEGVRYCTERGLLIGTDKRYFEPDATLTREQFVLILARYSNYKSYSYQISMFDDVSVNSWYGPAVIWAYDNGYIMGVGNGDNFGVGRPISREELAVIFLRFAVSKGINTTGRGDLSTFTDGDKVSSWAKDAVEWTIHTRLLGSTSSTEMILAPRMSVTRAQAAKIFMNFSK